MWAGWFYVCVRPAAWHWCSGIFECTKRGFLSLSLFSFKGTLDRCGRFSGPQAKTAKDASRDGRNLAQENKRSTLHKTTPTRLPHPSPPLTSSDSQISSVSRSLCLSLPLSLSQSLLHGLFDKGSLPMADHVGIYAVSVWLFFCLPVSPSLCVCLPHSLACPHSLSL